MSKLLPKTLKEEFQNNLCMLKYKYYYSHQHDVDEVFFN